MQDYAVVEEALRQRLISAFPNKLSETLCIAGDIDQLLRNIFSEDSLYGCLVDFGEAREANSEPYKTQIWMTRIVGVFIIRYVIDKIDANLREVLKDLRQLLKDDHRLGGTVDRAKLVAIETPEPTQVNDVSFLFLPFTVETWERV
jgi:hypothetical protein